LVNDSPHVDLALVSSSAQSQKKNQEHDDHDARAAGPEEVPSIPPGLELAPRALSRCLIHGAGIEPLKLVVQRDVDAKSWRVHTENGDERGDDEDHPVGSTELPQAHERRRY
jgi:hypothetical protein